MDSRTTRAPLRRCGAMARPVCKMNEMSGSRFLLSGVGTQMITASTSSTREKSVVASRRFALTCSATRLAGDVFDVAAPLVEGVDLLRVDIESEHIYTGACELQ